ncbi:4139_t:CDS:2, partial [Acaulospora colombiana]
MAESFYDLTALDIKKEPVQLSKYRNKVLLIVNVASKCGYTKQYENLESLYKKYQDKGLEIIGFPCNQFGKQEPDSEEVIKDNMCKRFDLTFPLFAKIEVTGENVSPVYEFLISHDPTKQGQIKWNFEKFVVDREGTIVGRYKSEYLPDENNEDDPLFKALNSS